MKLNIISKKSYPIYIGDFSDWKDIDFKQYAHVVLIGDEHVLPLYLEKMNQLIPCSVNYISFPAGESYKTRETKANIEDKLFSLGCGRDSLFIAFGGGVTLDLVGFIAATFCRGVDVIYVPTSLLAMVDASLGGKTAVNTSYGKNLIGCFSNPISVWVDVDFLKTLSLREFKSGMAEVIKHALIADCEFLNWLKVNKTKIYALEKNTLEQMILKSTEIKKQVVQQDEHEKGLRETLNFGHTVGHVVEVLSNYSILHGEAVAIGMLMECYIAFLMNYLSYDDYINIKEILSFFELAITPTFKFKFDLFINTLFLDKKVRHDSIHMVLLQEIGKVYHKNNQYSFLITKDVIQKAFDDIFNFLRTN